MRRILTCAVLLATIQTLYSQTLTITSINDTQNPVHRDNIGDWERTDTLHIQGSYTTDTVESVILNLMTFQKSPWSNLETYSITIAEAASSSIDGIIDTFLVIPENYMLWTADYSQMLQVRVNYTTSATVFQNFVLTVNEKTVPRTPMLIDFDAVYGTATGAELVTKLNTAVADAQDGDTLLFNSTEYDFEGNSFSFSKSICLSGAFPEIINEETIGAYDVSTTFMNMKNFNVRASNVTLTNLRFVPVETIGYVFTRFSHATENMFYTGILVKNVIFEDGQLQTYGQNGAGITFRNVSFLNFAHGGYNCNRTYPHDDLPKSTFKRCHFVPNFDEVFYNTRGVSMDAGNDNHPITWDMNGMHIDSCLFDGTGCGWSKGANAKVTNSHFIGYRGDVDMIHFEEYTNNILIENNTFEYSKPSRTFYIDRSLQPCSDITIINNTFKGKYKWVFWGNSPRNLRFEGNDMTLASANNPYDIIFDFTAHQTAGYEQAPYELPMENLIIRNNAGIDKTSIGVMSIYTLKDDDSNIIEAYPSSKIQKQEVDFRPKPLLDTNTMYRIVNKDSGEKMVAVDGSINVETTADVLTDSSDIWEVKFVYPYNYTFRNMKTKNYMEIYKIYTLGDYDKEELPTYHVEQKSAWEGETILPHWFLSKLDLTGQGEFQIYPGTNEKKSRVIKSGGKVVLDLAQDKENKEFFPTNAASTWKFVSTNTTGIQNSSMVKLNVFPNPANNILNVSFEGAKIENIQVYSINGTLVHSQYVERELGLLQINIDHLPKGMYLLKMGAEVNRLFTRK